MPGWSATFFLEREAQIVECYLSAEGQAQWQRGRHEVKLSSGTLGLGVFYGNGMHELFGVTPLPVTTAWNAGDESEWGRFMEEKGCRPTQLCKRDDDGLLAFAVVAYWVGKRPAAAEFQAVWQESDPLPPLALYSYGKPVQGRGVFQMTRAMVKCPGADAVLMFMHTRQVQ